MILFRQQGLLLVGPTGSGKTPLGALCEEKGLWGKTVLHFDFGYQLRQAARQPYPCSDFSEEDLLVIERSLRTNALLESKDFRIAEKILERFVRDNRVEQKHILMLNGLPRHVRQAQQIDAIIDIAMVVYLRCAPEVVYQRVARNTGGDRTRRTDDSEAEVRKKLGIFRERTLPLLQHYRAKDVVIEEIDIGGDSSAAQIHKKLASTTASPF